MSDLIPVSQRDALGFDASILAGGVAPSSQKMYARDFKAYLDYAVTPEKALLPSTLARWRTWLANTTTHSPNTINRMVSSVKAMMQSAEEQGYVPVGTWQGFKQVRGVKMGALKGRTDPNARTRIEPVTMRRLTDSPDPSTLQGLRDRALLHTLATSGLRINELATLTVRQISSHGEGHQLRVMGKNDIVFRDVPLSPEAHEYIERWLKERPVSSPFIFTSFAGRGRGLTDRAMTKVSVWRTIKRYAAQCKLSHIKPHDFRRFVGTELAKKAPRTAQKALGHKKISTTMDNYVMDSLEVGVTDKLY